MSENIKLLDSGTYGCVISPPISDEKSIIEEFIPYKNKDDNDVAKLYKNGLTSFQKELIQFTKIRRIDPNNIFTPKLKGALKINNMFINSNIETCLNNKIIYELILENAGQKINTNFKISYPQFLLLFKEFLEGMIKMQNGNLVHRDIKPANVLYNGRRLKLIDFGLMCEKEDVYNIKKSVSVLSYKYPFYPPEFYVAFIFIMNIKNEENSKDFVENIDNIYDMIERSEYFIFMNRYLQGENFNKFKLGIKDFLSDIKKSYTKYSDLFNGDLALKADIYPLSFVLSSLNKNIIFDNQTQKNFINLLFRSCIESNPLKRVSLQDLYEIVKEELNKALSIIRSKKSENIKGGGVIKKLTIDRIPRKYKIYYSLPQFYTF